MSKSIRIKDYLYEQIERLADQNRRSLIGQLEILLEQALKMEHQPVGEPLPKNIDLQADAQPRDIPARILGVDDDQGFQPLPPDWQLGGKHFKPDFKQPQAKKTKRRM